MAAPPPPPPPPHGSHAGGSGAGPGGGLPPGKYDIFVIPPHSAGGGFLYLPSLQPQRNSFLAGVACTLAATMVWNVVFPAFRDLWQGLANGGGVGVLLMVGGVGVMGWAWGKTQLEGGADWFGGRSSPSGGGAGAYGSGPGTAAGGEAKTGGGTSGSQSTGAFGGGGPTPHKPSWTRTKPPEPDPGTPKGSWEKARDEARRREEERKKAEEAKRKADELLKKREQEEKERRAAREKEARERKEREARGSTYQSSNSPRRPPNPTARTEADEDAFSYRPYDKPKPPPHATARTAHTGSSSAHSEFSYAHTHSTRASTPPPTNRGPYSTKDPDKIVIKAVYAFNHAFNNLPVAQLVSGSGSVTDGLILRITTEGLFIDDDLRGVPQREWDVKAWTMKLVESGDFRGLHVLRATIRDQEGKRYVFVLPEAEGWKVAVGLQRLRRGTQVRALGVSGLPQLEAKAILENLGFIAAA